MGSYKKHFIGKDALLRDALTKLDKLASDAILFVVDDFDRLLGSLTDGDVSKRLASWQRPGRICG